MAAYPQANEERGQQTALSDSYSACKRVHKSLGDEVAVAPSRPLRSASLPLIRATLHPLVQDDLTARVKHPLAGEPQRAQSGAARPTAWPGW